MQDFDYIAPEKIEDVIALLAGRGDDARILSGGTDLLVQLREGRKQARLVVDIKQVPEVNVLSFDPNTGLHIGAAVPCWRIADDDEICHRYPGLIDGIAIIGGMQIQGRATVGGNVCNSSPAADSIPALIVHEAVCEIAGPDGARLVPIEKFCTAPGKNVLKRGEFLVAMRVPPPPKGFGARYLRFIPRNEMDIAVVGAGASLVLDEDGRTIRRARLALGAVAPTPLLLAEAGRALVGREASDETFRQAALLAREAARPITDMRGSISQRTHLAGVLARRALEGAFERASEEMVTA